MFNEAAPCNLCLTKNTMSLFVVLGNEGDAHPLGALPVGTLVNNLEIQPGKGSEYIRAAGKSVTLCGFRYFKE